MKIGAPCDDGCCMTVAVVTVPIPPGADDEGKDPVGPEFPSEGGINEPLPLRVSLSPKYDAPARSKITNGAAISHVVVLDEAGATLKDTVCACPDSAAFPISTVSTVCFLPTVTVTDTLPCGKLFNVAWPLLPVFTLWPL